MLSNVVWIRSKSGGLERWGCTSNQCGAKGTKAVPEARSCWIDYMIALNSVINEITILHAGVFGSEGCNACVRWEMQYTQDFHQVMSTGTGMES
jgi:hypothetical protein